MTLPRAVPRYDGGGLAGVLPAVARALGAVLPPLDSSTGPDQAQPTTAPGQRRLEPILLPSTRRAVVVLVDGLGMRLLEQRRGHAPFLRTRLPDAWTLTCGFPTTTATSMGCFGTGTATGWHGLAGYEVLDPATDRLLNELSWQDGPDPRQWQPTPTVFERLSEAGVAVARVGRALFAESGLTNAALRGGRYVAAQTLAEGVDASVDLLRGPHPQLVYLYWGELDSTGHGQGCGSWQWGEQLASVDAELARLAVAAPKGTDVYLTADHGMVDVPFEARLDLATEPELVAGVRHAGGEARCRYLYCEPGMAPQVAETWRQRLSADAVVLTRQEAIASGWFGPVRPGVEARIGDVVVAMVGESAVVDSRRESPRLLSLLGVHGSVTEDEMLVPLLPIRQG